MATPLAVSGKPEVSREAEDLIPAGRARREDVTRETRDADQAEDAGVAEDAARASGDDDGAAGDLGSGRRAEMAHEAGGAADASDAGDLGAEAADDARDAGWLAGTRDVPSGAAAADDDPSTGKAKEPADAGKAGQARDAGSRDAGSRDDGSVGEPGTPEPSTAGKDRLAGAADAAPGRKPPLADDRDPEPGEKPDKPGTDEGDGSGVTPLEGEVTIVPGVSRYHRRGCILIRFLSDGDLETMTRGEAEAAGSIACKACQPDKPSLDS